MQVANEIIPADDVAAAVTDAYACPASATLIRRGFNDTYEVNLPNRRTVARVYLAGKYYLRDDTDIRYELDLLQHLAAGGVRVSEPLVRADGQLLGHVVDAAGATRPMALFTWAEGEPVAGKADNAEVAARFGCLIGSIHAVASSFASPHSRYRLDGEYLLEQPQRVLAQCLGDPSALGPYQDVLDGMREFLAAQTQDPPGFGYVHGDPHGRNVHIDEQGELTAFDFDHGGFGWRAYDAVTAAAGLEPQWHDDFRAGYLSAHPLEVAEESFARWAAVRTMWDVGDYLAMAPVMGRDLPPADQCLRYLDQLAEQWRAAPAG